jgi:hypothetical protein
LGHSFSTDRDYIELNDEDVPERNNA